jgi:hypothetical protein
MLGFCNGFLIGAKYAGERSGSFVNISKGVSLVISQKEDVGKELLKDLKCI